MVEQGRSDLAVGRQCQLLSISRSTFYAPPQGESDANLTIMAAIDRQFLDTPFSGVRQMTWHLRNDVHLINEKRIRRLMRLMGFMPFIKSPRSANRLRGTRFTHIRKLPRL